MDALPWPTKIHYSRDNRTLMVAFDTGTQFSIPARTLREESRAANSGQGAKDAAITDITPVGRYAIRLHFDDGHRTGLYTWKHLYELGQSLHSHDEAGHG